ncbi:MAG: MOSC N-terminal beta barrel domain-containing protein [Acidimicrobiales bacterium]
MQLGVVKELWRYPIKSVRGERVERTTVAARFGVVGDRAWAVRDEIVGEIRSAKRIAELLQCAARYVVEPSDVATPTVEITLPDGRTVRSDDPSVHRLLSGFLGRPVTLWPRVSDTEPEHYPRREAIDEPEMRRQYGLADDEPLPDMGQIPAEMLAELRRYVSPLGTYFDAFELHLLATASLDALRRRHPDAGVDVRRFRPNFVVDTGAATRGDFFAFGWVGHHVRIGEVLIHVLRPMQRCVMTVHA